MLHLMFLRAKGRQSLTVQPIAMRVVEMDTRLCLGPWNLSMVENAELVGARSLQKS